MLIAGVTSHAPSSTCPSRSTTMMSEAQTSSHQMPQGLTQNRSAPSCITVMWPAMFSVHPSDAVMRRRHASRCSGVSSRPTPFIARGHEGVSLMAQTLPRPPPAGQYPNWTIDRAAVKSNDLGAMSDTTSFQREHGPVTSELLVRLATLLNDYNPAHYDLDFAHEIGMPGVIGPGTLLQGWILSDVEAVTAAGAGPHRVREIDLRFRAPFLVGDTVIIDYEGDGDALKAEVRATDG